MKKSMFSYLRSLLRGEQSNNEYISNDNLERLSVGDASALVAGDKSAVCGGKPLRHNTFKAIRG